MDKVNPKSLEIKVRKIKEFFDEVIDLLENRFNDLDNVCVDENMIDVMYGNVEYILRKDECDGINEILLVKSEIGEYEYKKMIDVVVDSEELIYGFISGLYDRVKRIALDKVKRHNEKFYKQIFEKYFGDFN